MFLESKSVGPLELVRIVVGWTGLGPGARPLLKYIKALVAQYLIWEPPHGGHFQYLIGYINNKKIV